MTGREHPVLRYNAVFFLLHLAIADQALDHDRFIHIMEGNGDGPIEWNNALQDLPICRAVDRQGVVHPTKPMSFSVFGTILRRLLKREYEYDRASIHMIRRELGKQLDSTCHRHLPIALPTNSNQGRYTETERSQHILQADRRVFGQSYVAFVSSCDGFAAFMGEEPDHTAVEYFQGISRFWQPGLPTELPAALRAEVSTSPEIIEHDRKIQEAVDTSTRDRAKKDRQNAIKRLEKRTLELHRAECMKQMRNKRLIHGITPSALGDDLDPLNELIPEKGRVAEAMVSDSPLGLGRELGVMRDMVFLLTAPWTVFYRPEELPQDGACPYCGKKMER